MEVVWLAALAGSAAAWLGSDRWMLVFGLVCGFLAVWAMQAVHAHRRAVEEWAGREATGEMPGAGGTDGARPSDGASRVLIVAPVAVVAITLVFLVGGRVATPGATVERYVHAWIEGDAGAAASMFVEPLSADEMARDWSADGRRLAARLAGMAPPTDARPASPGLDLTFVRFEYPSEAPADQSTAYVDLWIVETVVVRSTVLGIFPASLRETRVVAHAGRATLRREPVGPALPFLPAAGIWRIERVAID
ncbi:hypothetical protein BH20CHL6_BH20CHL6_16960 [soil metagenome]